MRNKEIAELQHDMGGIAVAFEAMIRVRMPKDGTLEDDFQMWSDMFYAAMFAPHHAMAVQSAHDALDALLLKTPAIPDIALPISTTPTGGRPVKEI